MTAAVMSGVLLLWLYGSTIGRLIVTWHSQPDCVHGFLVVPFAAWMLWSRKSSFPTWGAIPGWGGLVLVAIAIAMRCTAERLMLPTPGGWSFVLWLAGACWLLAGFRVLVWAFPVLIYLAFMVPLPEQLSQLLGGPVQSLVTKTSAALLVCLGRPAIAEGATLFLNDASLNVAQSCSGLGIFFGIFAIAVAFANCRCRSNLEKLALIGAAPLIALITTAIRVASLAIFVSHGAAVSTGESPGRFAWMALGVAGALFSLISLYLRKLLIEVEIETGDRLLNHRAAG